jgi:hypothetical protein
VRGISRHGPLLTSVSGIHTPCINEEGKDRIISHHSEYSGSCAGLARVQQHNDLDLRLHKWAARWFIRGRPKQVDSATETDESTD